MKSEYSFSPHKRVPRFAPSVGPSTLFAPQPFSSARLHFPPRTPSSRTCYRRLAAGRCTRHGLVRLQAATVETAAWPPEAAAARKPTAPLPTPSHQLNESERFIHKLQLCWRGDLRPRTQLFSLRLDFFCSHLCFRHL